MEQNTGNDDGRGKAEAVKQNTLYTSSIYSWIWLRTNTKSVLLWDSRGTTPSPELSLHVNGWLIAFLKLISHLIVKPLSFGQWQEKEARCPERKNGKYCIFYRIKVKRKTRLIHSRWTPRDTLSNNNTRFPVWWWKLFHSSHSGFLKSHSTDLMSSIK